MPPTDVDRKPKTNEEIVAYMHKHVHGMHFCPVIGQTVGKKVTKFEFRTDFKGTLHCFEGTFLDGSASSKVLGTTPKEQFQKYARAKALEVLLDDVCFPTVEVFAVSCRNALGDNIDTLSLAGAIFVEGKCVDELLDAIEDKRFAEPVASAAEDKTEDKDQTDDKTEDKDQTDGKDQTHDKTDGKDQTEDKDKDQTDNDNTQLATEVQELKQKMKLMMEIVAALCHSKLEIV